MSYYNNLYATVFTHRFINIKEPDSISRRGERVLLLNYLDLR